MASQKPTSRRDFLTGAGTAAAALGIPAIIPSHVLADPRSGRPGANDRVVTANIGVGGMGSSHIRPDSAALCDVDDGHLARAAERVTQGTPELFKDWRRLLERKDIDAVFIATPDHWHAIMAVSAAQAGKHVYTEKPVCKSIEEGRAMLNAARRYNRVMQVGMQGRSNPMAKKAADYVRNGNIGKVQRVEIWHPVNFASNEWFEPKRVPSTLDWDMWLGPTRWSPYHPLKGHFNFRWFWDSGEGFIRDRGNHAINVVSWVTGNDNYKGKVTCNASGTIYPNGIFETPATMHVEWDFHDPKWTLVWDQPGKPNPRLPGDWGATYYGDKDSLVVLGGDGVCDTEQKAKEYKVPSGGWEAPLFAAETGDPAERHRLNFLDCCKTGKRPASDIEIGFHVITLPILGNIAYKLGRPVTYDYATERFDGDDEANRMLSIPYRHPWHL